MVVYSFHPNNRLASSNKKTSKKVKVVKRQHSILSSLKTHHFTHLLCCLRNPKIPEDPVVVPPKTQLFGIYVAMHRVYITCLDVHSNSIPLDRTTASKRDLYFINMHESSQFKATNKSQQFNQRFRLLGNRYLNFLKPTHFKALMDFLLYMSWHAYREDNQDWSVCIHGLF